MNVLITGGSRGIGAAAVRLFCRQGWKVAFTYLNSQKEALALEAQMGPAAHAIRADAASAQETLAFTRAAEERFGPPDVLICNAGISYLGLFQSMSLEDFKRVIDVNLIGAANACRAVIPSMVRRKEGCILLVSSMWGQVGASCEVAYSAAKAGLIGLGKALAKELGPSGIRVNCIAPGAIDTDMNKLLDESARQDLCSQTPLGRLGRAQEVADTMLFLVKSGFLTGQVISPNGGLVI